MLVRCGQVEPRSVSDVSQLPFICTAAVAVAVVAVDDDDVVACGGLASRE